MTILMNCTVLLMSFFSTSWAIEPMDPLAMCSERMIQKEDLSLCEKQASSLKLDWYAARACNAIYDNKKFFKCWQKIAGGEFNTEALGRCVEKADDSDESILTCIVSLKDKRTPASQGAFQTLKVSKPRKK